MRLQRILQRVQHGFSQSALTLALLGVSGMLPAYALAATVPVKTVTPVVKTTPIIAKATASAAKTSASTPIVKASPTVAKKTTPVTKVTASANKTVPPVASIPASTPMALRIVPIEVGAYPEAATLSTAVQTPEGTVKLINTTQPLLVHMEALREAFAAYGQDAVQVQALLKPLKERYMADQDNASKFFDYGYAQLVMLGDKNGLFFLRKANDKLASPYTSLAYGLAEIDADLIMEKSTPDEETTRKMDVTYKLKDALTLNKDAALAGVWPTYVHILENIKPYKAYESLENEDVTMMYVPYGSNTADSDKPNAPLVAMLPADTLKIANASDAAVSTGLTATTASSYSLRPCKLSDPLPALNTFVQSKTIELNRDHQPISVDFYLPNPAKAYDVVVRSPNKNVIGRFQSYKAPYIWEDLDHDGTYELVVRQFDKDPYHPLYVYRWNGQCFGEDQRVSALFQ